MHGPARLVAELIALGYAASEVAAPDGSKFVIISPFVVPAGRFADRVVDLALPATPDFPITVASAIHLRAAPQLYEITDTIPNVRNITASVLGPEWRYWSRNFGWTEQRSARRLMSQINEIFINAT